IRWISAHDLWFPQTAWAYLTYSEDRELAPRLLTASEAVMAFYAQRRIDGLHVRAHPDACRWVEWNMNAAQEISTWENLLAVESWRAVGRMREYLGAGDPAAATRAAAE